MTTGEEKPKRKGDVFSRACQLGFHEYCIPSISFFGWRQAKCSCPCHDKLWELAEGHKVCIESTMSVKEGKDGE